MNTKSEHIEGIHATLEALNYNVPITELWIGDYINFKNNKSIQKINDIAKNNQIKVFKKPKNVLDKLSFRGAHQGVIAKTKAFPYCSLQDILKNAKDKSSALVVVLDHIEDSGNLGAIARSAEAFGAAGLVIPNKRAAAVTASTYKTSAGAICRLPIAMVANINSVLDELKNNEFWVASASEHTNAAIWDQNLKGKIALVMGSEHNGVSQLVLKNSDFIVKLPMAGKIESLNVAQAFTACAYEWVRQNNVQ